MLNCLAEHLQVQLEDEGPESEQDGAEDAADDCAINNDLGVAEFGEEEPTAEPIQEAITDQSLAQIEAQLQARCEVNEGLIAKLLCHCSCFSIDHFRTIKETVISLMYYIACIPPKIKSDTTPHPQSLSPRQATIFHRMISSLNVVDIAPQSILQ